MPVPSGDTVDPRVIVTVAGTGYEFNLPESWEQPAQDPTDGLADIFVAHESASGGPPNLSVVLSPTVITPDDVERDGRASLEAVGATDVLLGGRVEVGGGDSAHLSAVLSQDGVEAAIDQFYATRAGQTYIITFTFPVESSDADRAAVYESVLITWSWS